MTSDDMPGAILIPKPDFSEVALSPQGQLMVPVLSGLPTGNAPGAPFSAGWPYMQPSWVSNRHRHNETWVMILLWAGTAITYWGPDYENKILQRPGEIVLVRPGVNHVAVNANDTEPVLACEVRNSPDISLDNIPLEGVAKGFRDVPVDELNKLLDHPASPLPPHRAESAGHMPIHPFQGYNDEDLGRWAR